MVLRYPKGLHRTGVLMNSTSRLLDAAKSRQAIPSDYKLGVTLGLSDSAITNYRKGRSKPDDVVAQRLAELAGLDPAIVVAQLHAERAQTDDTRKLWETIAKRLKGTAHAALATCVILSMTSGWPDGTARAATRADAGSSSAGCILCQLACAPPAPRAAPPRSSSKIWAAWYALRYHRSIALPVEEAAVIQFIVDHALRHDTDETSPHARAA